MKFKVETSELAKENLRDISHHISIILDNPFAAKKICGEIRRKRDALADNPYMYPVYDVDPWADMKLRFFLVGEYMVFYRVDEAANMVYILKIAHGKQSPENRMKGI